MSRTRKISVFLSILIPLLLGAVMLFKPHIHRMVDSSFYPECSFHAITGYLCPGCGNTRAVLSLLDGNIIQSLRYNPVICILTGILLALYAELVCCAFGKKVYILPRSNLFLFVTLGLVLTYYVARNFFPWMTDSFY